MDGSAAVSTGHVPRAPKVDESQHTRSSSQSIVTPVQGYLIPYSGFCWHLHAFGAQICTLSVRGHIQK